MGCGLGWVGLRWITIGLGLKFSKINLGLGRTGQGMFTTCQMEEGREDGEDQLWLRPHVEGVGEGGLPDVHFAVTSHAEEPAREREGVRERDRVKEGRGQGRGKE